MKEPSDNGIVTIIPELLRCSFGNDTPGFLFEHYDTVSNGMNAGKLVSHYNECYLESVGKFTNELVKAC